MLCERVCGLLVFYWGLIGFLSFLFVLICVHLLVNDDTECKVDYLWFGWNGLIKETLINSTVAANYCVMRCSKCSHMSEYAALSVLL